MPRVQEKRHPFPDDFSEPADAAARAGWWYWARKNKLHVLAGCGAVLVAFGLGEVGRTPLYWPGAAHLLGAIGAGFLVIPATLGAYRRFSPLAAIVVFCLCAFLFDKAGIPIRAWLVQKFHLTPPIVGGVVFLVVAVVGVTSIVFGERGRAFLKSALHWLLMGRPRS